MTGRGVAATFRNSSTGQPNGDGWVVEPACWLAVRTTRRVEWNDRQAGSHASPRKSIRRRDWPSKSRTTSSYETSIHSTGARLSPVIDDTAIICEMPRNVLVVVGPADRRETGLPAGERDVAQVSTTDDHPGARPEQANQAEDLSVAEHLVDDPGGRDRCQHIQTVEVAAGGRSCGNRVESANGVTRIGEGLADELGQRFEDTMHFGQLTHPVDLGVGREDLFDQGCTRARKPDDEYRPRVWVAPAAATLDEFRSKCGDDPVDEA